MASVSITNQTLTMTITIDGVDTVIRKDNCKVQAFGDVVRITDYKGSIYEFLFSDCNSPSESNANDLRDAIEEFLNTGGGGGGGITSLTSTDGSVDIDLTDPSAPDLSIPSGAFTPVASDVTGSVNITGGCFSRAGQVVTMSFQFEVGAEAGTADIVFDFTLPVSVTFANARQLFGSNSSNTDLAYCIFGSNGDKGNIRIETQDVDQTVQNISVTVQYFIP